MRILAICSVTAVILLAGCATQPVPTLEEKLAGKSPAERQMILREACNDEASKGHKGVWPGGPRGYDTTYVPHVQKLGKICNEMTSVPQSQKGDK